MKHPLVDLLLAMSARMPVAIDVGDGWIQPPPPDHPTFRNGKAKLYQKDAGDGFFNLIIERRMGVDDATIFPNGRWHMSMSHNSMVSGPQGNIAKRMPTWDELKAARYKFLPKDINMAIMMPPENMYYSLHETCIHMVEIPVSMALDPKQRGGI
jgi:hypothetical protein